MLGARPVLREALAQEDAACPPVNITILNKHKHIRLRKAALKVLIEKVCYRLGIKRGTVSFVFTDDRQIRLLNKRYFGKDRPTDVVCFNLADRFDPSDLLGEIIISLERAQENCRCFSTDNDEELFLYVIHGLLHLSGLKDKTPMQKKRMRRKENELLSFFLKKEKVLLRSIIV